MKKKIKDWLPVLAFGLVFPILYFTGNYIGCVNMVHPSYNGWCTDQYLYDGPDLVSTGQRVTEWTARQMTNVNRINLVNANASTFEYVTVEGFTADSRLAA